MTTHRLLEVLHEHYQPDPKIVSQLDKNGVVLDYVGHAEITKILCEVDPEWSWEPACWIDGRPATHTQLGQIKKRDGTVIDVPTVSLWGRLTLLGVTRVAVGSVEAHKPDLDKELVSDFLRNAAMRFGISLGLWAKSPGDAPKTAYKPREASAGPQVRTTSTAPASDAQKRLLRSLKYAGDPAGLTKAEASAEIERLKTAQVAEAFDVEEPF
ncbi:MAG: hypothetical protein EBR30_27905 [Cytophagia bacterium]|nr:hypothetical protein [Cytophagia bacterium]